MARFRLPFSTPRQLQQDIDDELAFHLSISAKAHEQQGLSPTDARASAEARLGDLPELRGALYRIDRRSAREKSVMTWLDELRRDLRFSFRRTCRRPLLFVLIIATLAIGTGTVMTFFGAADAILLRPLALTEPDRVMTIWRSPAGNPEIRTGLAIGTVMDLAEESRTFSTIASAEPYGYAFVVDGEARMIDAWRVTEGFFDVFRTRPYAGRLLERTDFDPASPPTMVVGYEFFQTYLGGDLSTVGGTALLDGEAYTVAGVLPADFLTTEPSQLFTTLAITGEAREDRRSDYHYTFGRLRQGATPAVGLEDLRDVARRSDARIAGPQAVRDVQIIPLADAIFGPFRAGLGLLALGAILLLAMAATNAAGLMVADTLDRYRELTIRASVGAGRGRIIRQLMTESTVFALTAGMAGFALGVAGLRAFQRWAPADLPRIADVGVDFRVASIAAAAVLMLALSVGLLLARLVSRTDLAEALKESASPWDGHAGRGTRLLLVGTQVALASILLGGGGLLIRSWMVLQAEDQGYIATGVVGMEAHVWQFFPTAAARTSFGLRAVEILTSQPDVESAALASSLPLAPPIGNERARISRPGTGEDLNFRAVVGSPGIFDLLRVPVIQGNGFGPEHGDTGEPVVVLSRAAASMLFPGEDPLGQIVEVSYSAPPQPRRVVGVVGDVRFGSPAARGEPTLYLPHTQAPTGSVYLTVRYPEATTTFGAFGALRELVPGASDPSAVPLGEIADLGRLLREATAPRRFSTLLLSAFSAVALLLTAVGLFGLLAQNVRVRLKELGIRMAIGARPGSLRKMILGEGLRLAGVGVVAGILSLLFLSNLFGRILYGIPPHDPVTIGSVTLLMLTVAVVASWWPAAQATRIDPGRVMRSE